MSLFYSKPLTFLPLKDKYVLLDNDFLGAIFSDTDIFSDFLKLLSENYITLDSLTKFEFLRDVYLPEQKEIKEKFITDETIFHSFADEQTTVFKQAQENALLLSQIYAHQNVVPRPSFVDLILAGKLMRFPGRTVIITGNKKDFPLCVFDTKAIINHESKKDGKIQVFSILEFNEVKFEKCLEDLSKLSESIK